MLRRNRHIDARQAEIIKPGISLNHLQPPAIACKVWIYPHRYAPVSQSARPHDLQTHEEAQRYADRRYGNETELVFKEVNARGGRRGVSGHRHAVSQWAVAHVVEYPSSPLTCQRASTPHRLAIGDHP